MDMTATTAQCTIFVEDLEVGTLLMYDYRMNSLYRDVDGCFLRAIAYSVRIPRLPTSGPHPALFPFISTNPPRNKYAVRRAVRGVAGLSSVADNSTSSILEKIIKAPVTLLSL